MWAKFKTTLKIYFSLLPSLLKKKHWYLSRKIISFFLKEKKHFQFLGSVPILSTFASFCWEKKRMGSVFLSCKSVYVTLPPLHQKQWHSWKGHLLLWGRLKLFFFFFFFLSICQCLSTRVESPYVCVWARSLVLCLGCGRLALRSGEPGKMRSGPHFCLAETLLLFCTRGERKRGGEKK